MHGSIRLTAQPPKAKPRRVACHLFHGDCGYYARMGVPHDVRVIIGQKEFWAAIHAETDARAVRKLPATIARWHSAIEGARAEAKAQRVQAQPRQGRSLTARQLAVTHYGDQVQFDDELRNADSHYSHGFVHEQYIALLRRVASGSADNEEMQGAVGWIIGKFQATGNLKAQFGTTEWRKAARALAVAELESSARTWERDEGDFTGTPSNPLLTEKPAAASTPDPLAARILNDDSTKTLREILPDFIKERKPSERTAYEYRLTVGLFEEALGEDKPVYRITRADVIAFKRVLQDLPANHTKRFPDLTVLQAIKVNKGRADPFKPLHSKTINNKYLTALRSLLNWCWNNGILPDNQAAGIRVEETKSTEPDRLPFAPGDIAKIFAPERFATRPFDETQWASLISLFGGMRASELAQIKLDSIRHERGLLVFVIEERTKSITSRRLVPVHSALVALGLNERVDSLRSSGATHLFPDWYKKGEAKRNFEAFIPKAFNVTTKKKLGIVGRKVWHSFRHTFKTGLARAGVDRSTRDLLCGHADNSAGAVYVHDTSVDTMRDAIEKLHFDGFIL
jgi:integrase